MRAKQKYTKLVSAINIYNIFLKFSKILISILASFIFLMFINKFILNLYISFIFSILLYIFLHFIIKFKLIDIKKLSLAIEIKNPNTKFPIWSNDIDSFDTEIKEIIKNIYKNLIKNTFFIFSLFFLIFIILIYIPYEDKLFNNDYNLIIEIKKGLVSGKDKIILDSKDTKKIELKEDNLLFLYLENEKMTNSKFILEPFDKRKTKLIFNLDNNNFKFPNLNIVVKENSLVYMPKYFKDKVLAKIYIKGSSVPHISLTSKTNFNFENYWDDDKIFPVSISVESQSKIKSIFLEIDNGKNISKELVNHFTIPNKNKLNINYNLNLKSYANQDISNLTITGIAYDNTSPKSLIGYSNSLNIKVSSSYGRYNQSLIYLNDIKNILDNGITNITDQNKKKMLENIEKAYDISKNVPFFNFYDRLEMSEIYKKIYQIKNMNKMQISTISDLSNQLNDFLFEHEMLNHRQRDRDFFNSIRDLSDLIELNEDKNLINKVILDIIKFTEERRKVWQKRVEFISNKNISKEWNIIKKNKPIIGILNDLLKNKYKKHQKQNKLSDISVVYQKWINKLENAEDDYIKNYIKKYNNDINSTKSEIDEIVNRQIDISSDLDKAAIQKKNNFSEIQNNWPITRMKQNSNIKNMGKLNLKIDRLMPIAKPRFELALNYMNKVKSFGQDLKFILAETSSDISVRLLKNLKSKLRNKKNMKFRKRKRSSGNDYYGSSIINGNLKIKNNYNIDQKYRENILQKLIENKDNSSLQKNYIKEIIR